MNTNACLAMASVGALVLGVASLGGIGCGSSSSGSGGTTSATGAGTTTSTTSSTKATTTGTGTTTTASTGTGLSPCYIACETAHPAGFAVLYADITQFCGCKPSTPCNAQCMSDPACASMGVPAMGNACDNCLQAEGAKAQNSMCAVMAVTGGKCPQNTDCTAFIGCATNCQGG